MNNYRILFSFLLFFFFTQITTSQKNNQNSSRSNKKFTSEKSIENHFMQIEKKLGLDGLQMVIVKNIILKYNDKIKLLRDQYGNGQIMMAEINDINLKRDEELSKVLTEDQMVILHEFQLEQRKEREIQARNNYRSRNSNSSRSSNRSRRRQY